MDYENQLIWEAYTTPTNDIFAVFVVCEVREGMFCATTRAMDRGEDSNTVGFPGGKIDPEETLQEAAHRESIEEGWKFGYIDEKPFFTTMVEGKLVAWLKGKNPTKLQTYKEQHRILPVLASVENIKNQNPRFKNKEALEAYNYEA